MNLPEIGESITLEDGTITRLSEVLFVGTTPSGGSYYSRRGMTQPTTAYRFVENRLLKAAGKATEAALCAHCGLRPKAIKSSYCSHECKCAALRSNSSRLSASEEFFLTLSREDILARLAAISPAQPAPEYTTAPPPDFAHLIKNEPLRVTMALRAADALIARRKGYAVLDKVLARAQRRQVLKSEKTG